MPHTPTRRSRCVSPLAPLPPIIQPEHRCHTRRSRCLSPLAPLPPLIQPEHRCHTRRSRAPVLAQPQVGLEEYLFRPKTTDYMYATCTLSAVPRLQQVSIVACTVGNLNKSPALRVSEHQPRHARPVPAPQPLRYAYHRTSHARLAAAHARPRPRRWPIGAVL